MGLRIKKVKKKQQQSGRDKPYALNVRLPDDLANELDLAWKRTGIKKIRLIHAALKNYLSVSK